MLTITIAPSTADDRYHARSGVAATHNANTSAPAASQPATGHLSGAGTRPSRHAIARGATEQQLGATVKWARVRVVVGIRVAHHHTAPQQHEHRHRQHDQDRSGSGSPPQQPPKGKRPEEVELDLLRQRPGRHQRSEHLAVARDERRDPVVCGQQRRRDQPSERPQPGEGMQHQNHDGEAGEQREQRRHQAARATFVEPAQLDRAGSIPLLVEQRRDQEAGEREEHVDAHVAARDQPEVDSDDDHDREPAQPVQRWAATEPHGCRRAAGLRFGVRGPILSDGAVVPPARDVVRQVS